jgi:crotonobetainyl-CoA:carnitine CoA-transferase CaiB-like acyl-CoA transferase
LLRGQSRYLPAVPAPLADLRVLECGDTVAIAYAGRQLADLGADVVKIEAPQGDPLRAVGPFVGGIPDREMSGSFAYFNAGKRPVVVGPAPDDGRRLKELASRANVILRGTRAGEDWLADAEVARLRVADPSLIVVDISAYGRQGEGDSRPFRAQPFSDVLALAASGFLSLNASVPTDPKARPIRYKGELSSVHAGANAVLVLGRPRRAPGRRRPPPGRGSRNRAGRQAAEHQVGEALRDLLQ